MNHVKKFRYSFEDGLIAKYRYQVNVIRPGEKARIWNTTRIFHLLLDTQAAEDGILQEQVKPDEKSLWYIEFYCKNVDMVNG